MTDLGAVFIGIVGIFFVFLVIREFIMWYWKINRIVGTLERIEVILDDMDKHLRHTPPKKHAAKKETITS